MQTHAELVLTELREGEHVGYGEAAPSERVTGETTATVVAFLEWARGEVEKLDVERGWEKFLDEMHANVCGNGAARAAVDLALHDLVGKLAGEPVHVLYGLEAKRAVTCATVSIDEPARMAAEAVDHRALGFTALKLKLGEATRDVERAVACRRGVPDAALRADANASWSEADARRILPKLVAPGVEFVEQPFAPRELDALAALSRESPVAIYADESVAGPDDVERLATRGFRGGVNVKLMKAGGIRPALATLRSARERGYGTQIGCMVESAIGISAATHLLALADHVDLDGNWLLARDAAHGAKARAGWIETPRGKGLGVELS